eukprot:GHVS01061825.1.p1 GENE.GHVS01061825.1~~GHVS01061825.1.p1  ORF type:complete len:163 (-),score=38.08 GHVS01061825.1:628-1068(-)
MSVVECQEQFGVPAEVLFEVFVSSNLLTRMARGAKAEVDAKVGGSFSLYDGNIKGTFEVIEQHKRIVQKWRFKDWCDGVYSTVDISFSPVDKNSCSTKLTLKQTNIPTQDKYNNGGCVDQCTAGWDTNFWDRIEKILGYARMKNNN